MQNLKNILVIAKEEEGSEPSHLSTSSSSTPYFLRVVRVGLRGTELD